QETQVRQTVPLRGSSPESHPAHGKTAESGVGHEVRGPGPDKSTRPEEKIGRDDQRGITIPAKKPRLDRGRVGRSGYQYDSRSPRSSIRRSGPAARRLRLRELEEFHANDRSAAAGGSDRWR